MSEAATRAPVVQQPAPAVDLARRPRIVIVDQNAQRAQLVAAAFGDDYQVAIADGADRAVRACAEDPPELWLVDAGIGGGVASLCLRLSSMPGAAAAPVMVVTEPGDQVGQIEALDAGAVDFMARPIHPKALRARVGAQVLVRRQAEMLRQGMTIDVLTGVCNREHFDERLAAEWARAVRQGTLLSVLRIEPDEFAAYLAHHGPVRADDCLRRIGALLRASLKRPGDLAARYAGAEFVCLLPDTDLEGGLDLAHRLNLALRGLRIEHGASAIAPMVTASMGLACKPVDVVGSVGKLLRESSAQLQVARSRGCNQACGGELEDA